MRIVSTPSAEGPAEEIPVGQELPGVPMKAVAPRTPAHYRSASRLRLTPLSLGPFMFGLRPLVTVLLIGNAAALFYWTKKDDAADASPTADVDKAKARVVWSADKPAGKTWSTLNSEVKIGRDEGKDGPAALVVKFGGEGYRGGGLNWKGWFPEDACDDASAFNCLVFHVRQLGAIADADLSVRLVDNTKGGGDPDCNEVRAVADGGVPVIDREWRKVVLPLEKFARGRTLDLKRLWGIDFSNFGRGDLSFHIDRVGFANETVLTHKFAADGRLQGHGPRRGGQAGAPHPGRNLRRLRTARDKLKEYGVPLVRWAATRRRGTTGSSTSITAGVDWFFKNRGKPIKTLDETAIWPSCGTAREASGSGHHHAADPRLGGQGRPEPRLTPCRSTASRRPSSRAIPTWATACKHDGTPVRGNDPTRHVRRSRAGLRRRGGEVRGHDRGPGGGRDGRACGTGCSTTSRCCGTRPTATCVRSRSATTNCGSGR